MDIRVTLRHPLVALALTLTIARAFAADGAALTATGQVRDSDGQPVSSSSAACWQSVIPNTGAPLPCGSADTNPPIASPAVKDPASRQPQPHMTTGTQSLDGHPGYVTDAAGHLVRSSQGECWHTSSWSPELATVVGCDGVLARAVAIPAPAASPRPQPPAASPAMPTTSAPGSPATASEIAPLATPDPDEKAPLVPGGGAKSGAAVVPPVPAPATPLPLADDNAAGTTPERHNVPTSEKVTLDTDTYFDFDKAILKPAGKHNLDVLITRINQMDLEVVVATGHTDSTGTPRYNQRLSERRALAVKNYLMRKLPGNRIFIEGKGENQPVASNATREGREQNRRVDVEMVGIRAR